MSSGLTGRCVESGRAQVDWDILLRAEFVDLHEIVSLLLDELPRDTRRRASVTELGKLCVYSVLQLGAGLTVNFGQHVADDAKQCDRGNPAGPPLQVGLANKVFAPNAQKKYRSIPAARQAAP